MRTILTIILLTISLSGNASNITDDISNLSHDDYDIREEATNSLADLPKEYISVLLKLSEAFANDNLETAWRLEEAARRCFVKQWLPNERRWRLVKGWCGAELAFRSYWKEDNEDGYYYVYGSGVVVEFVYLDSPAEGVLAGGDVIVQINGRDSTEFKDQLYWGTFEEGKEYELIIHRYENHDPFVGEFKEIKVKITCTTKLPTKDHHALAHEEDVKNTLWKEYKEQYKNFSKGQ